MDICQDLCSVFIIWILTAVKDTGSSCMFPEFVWRSSGGELLKIWTSETSYISNRPLWDTQKKYVANMSEIIMNVEYPWICENEEEVSYDKDGRPLCINSDTRWRIKCIRHEGGGKYRVMYTGEGYTKFSCLRFTQRNKNIMQIEKAKPRDINEARLCDEDSLFRDDWPWIAEEQEEWQACPLVGGFDFRTYTNERKKMLCHRVWRPSRLESECILGEGMQFLFPEKTCSFFYHQRLEIQLYCWAVWTEGVHQFILLGEQGQPPQFIMRTPIITQPSDVKAHIYFSPIAPIRDDGSPEDNTMHMQLKMTRSETGMCFDEGDNCRQYARDGKCISDGYHQYLNYCKKSCGLCGSSRAGLVASSQPECDFPLPYQGEWLLFEQDRKEAVNIGAGKLTFSKLGTFICKSKHWAKDFYKFISVYENGCRPRFTCIDFQYDDRDFLKYRLSRSSHIDRSFDLCHFQNDSTPLRDRIRSKAHKILFPITKTQMMSCGLGGLIHLQASFNNGRSCRGTLSDWLAYECRLSSNMRLDFRHCRDGVHEMDQDFTCEAYIDMQNNYRLLLTKDAKVEENPKYSCWLIKMGPANRTHHNVLQWKNAYMLQRAQCGFDDDLDEELYKRKEVAFQIYPGPLETKCLKVTQHASTIRYTVTKSSKGQRSSRTQEAASSHIASHTQSASSSVHHSTTLHAILLLTLDTSIWLLWKMVMLARTMVIAMVHL